MVSAPVDRSLTAAEAREASERRAREQESLWPRIEKAVEYLTARGAVNHFSEGIFRVMKEQR